jgi:hypothetical protein
MLSPNLLPLLLVLVLRCTPLTLRLVVLPCSPLLLLVLLLVVVH